MPPDRPVVIHNYCPQWPSQFDSERGQLQQILPNAVIEHIGSTAVVGLSAKPIIDVMMGVSSLAEIESRIAPLENLGYEYVPKHEAVLPQRRYFTKSIAQRKAFHLHAVVAGSDFWRIHLAFRDALRADPALAQRYAALKRQLAAQHAKDREAYTDAKAPFIAAVMTDIRAAQSLRA